MALVNFQVNFIRAASRDAKSEIEEHNISTFFNSETFYCNIL